MGQCPMCGNNSSGSSYSPFCSFECKKAFNSLSQNNTRIQIKHSDPNAKMANAIKNFFFDDKKEKQEKEEARYTRQSNWDGFGYKAVFIGNNKTRHVCPECGKPELEMGTGLLYTIGTGGGTISCKKCKYKKTFKQLVEEGGAKYN